jgi:hypothetical protein
VEIHLGQQDVDMGVDQPWHQCAAAQVDARRGRAADRPIGDFLDAIVLDQHVRASRRALATRLEEPTAVE